MAAEKSSTMTGAAHLSVTFLPAAKVRQPTHDKKKRRDEVLANLIADRTQEGSVELIAEARL